MKSLRYRLIGAAALTVLLASTLLMMPGRLMAIVHAQQAPGADGEFCVRAFEDSNSNGVRDLNEPPLQGGISANLLDASGIVIASALLDNSPTVARGLICFQFLPEGQYEIEVVSADYTATTASVMTNIVHSGEVPFVMEFGAHRIAASPAAATTATDQTLTETEVMRIVLAVAGAVAVVAFMSLVGFLIYLIGYRGRIRREMSQMRSVESAYQRPSTTPTTGSIPRVTDTGEYRRK